MVPIVSFIGNQVIVHALYELILYITITKNLMLTPSGGQNWNATQNYACNFGLEYYKYVMDFG